MPTSVNSYDVNDCLNRANNRLTEFKQGGEAYLLLYAGLDSRLCIERTLFEYLVRIHSTNVPKRLERLYRAGNLKKAIEKEEPHFFKTLEFLNVYLEFIPGSKPIARPDLELLSRGWGRMNGYLHAPKNAGATWLDPGWWEKLKVVLEPVIKHLIEIHSGYLAGIKFTNRGEELFRRFVSDEIDADGLRVAFREAEPPQKLE